MYRSAGDMRLAGRIAQHGELTMPILTGETVKQVLHDLYGYDISDDDARAMANAAGAMLTMARGFGALGLGGIEPPFGYPNLLAEAQRLAQVK
jgi:hypothetical protein